MSFSVEMCSIDKAFGSLKALDKVDLQVTAGTIHGVVGENGAGKTTLMRILYGALSADGGTYSAEGKEGPFKSTAEAIKHGIGMVSQHYSIIPDLTAIENLALGSEPSWIIDWKSQRERAEILASKMGFSFDWNLRASTLSPAGAQKLEILKLLWRNARIMILDEPTAMLSPLDSDALFSSLKKLVAEGATVLLVTHRLPEVLQHCDNVTVLRSGKRVAQRSVKGLNSSDLAELIVGHSMEKREASRSTFGASPLLEVQEMRVRGARGNLALKGLNLTVRKGEILGIAGVDGSGQRELFQGLMGQLKLESGEIRLGGQEISESSTLARMRLGLRLIPEDRFAEGVIEDWSLEENAALGLQRFRPFAAGACVDSDGRRAAANDIADRFQTKRRRLSDPLSSLSGGNQQRFVAARAMYLTPLLLLGFQPSRGLDIDATRNLYEGIREECAKGASALIVSFDLDELLENCDRIAVMNGGEVFLPPQGRELDRTTIGRLMVGAA